MSKKGDNKRAWQLHQDLPPGYYEKSIEKNPLQRFWHQRRFYQISRLIEPVKGKVLDIGSADGTFTKIIAESTNARQVIGIDILPTSVDYANQKFKNVPGIGFQLVDAHRLPFKNDIFDAVFCLESMEHLKDPDLVMSEIRRVLKKGGYLIVLVPTDNQLFQLCWWVVLHTWGKHWQETHVQSFNQENNLADYIRSKRFIIEKEQYFLLKMLVAVKARKK